MKKGYGPPLQLDVKCRTYYKGPLPRPIKLEIPGWAGNSRRHDRGAVPQPWHCPPFVDGSTYGLELIYPFDSPCHVTRRNNEVVFEGDFEGENPWNTNGDSTPPFATFAPSHYGYTSSLDILPPPDYVVRIEPHPRFYTDTTGTVPIPVAGHIQRWWSKIFFIAFKSPFEGQTHIFEKGQPYAQILIIPRKIVYNVTPMSDEEAKARSDRETQLSKLGNKIAKNVWIDHAGHEFSDKYRQLSNAYHQGGEEAVEELIKNAGLEASNYKRPKTRISKKIFKPHDKILQNQEKR